jgi:glycosyltransferase involved in cell wall biosynthesis
MNRISIVTPTLRRPAEVDAMLDNLVALTHAPHELIIVDAGPPDDTRTQELVERRRDRLPFPVVYVTHARGTAIQRNAGIERASGDFVAFVDDDVRLEPNFFDVILATFERDRDRKVGAIVGFRTNQNFALESRARWRLYRGLRLLSTYEPGHYDYKNGYPINLGLQTAFSGTREVDVMNSSNVVYRREVFDSGLRFDPFFRDYGVLEDAHLALMTKRSGWTLLQSGDAHCVHLHSPVARSKKRALGRKSVENYYYVFQSVAAPLSMSQQLGFWRFQAAEVIRLLASSVRRRRVDDLEFILGKIEATIALARRREP